jgi:aquaporin Z
MRDALTRHWPEYLMEAAELGIFMVSACAFTILLYHPSSPALHAIPSELVRRLLAGVAMGLTLVALVYSPWGKRSGAHMNPAFTLAFWSLGKVAPWDALFYVAAQFAGGIAGIGVVALVAESSLSHPAVNYVATLPGEKGIWPAFAGETVISFALLAVVLVMAGKPTLAPRTGLIAGFCVAAFIALESPLSGMSMNPARSFGSAFFPHLWNSLWIYFVAPPLGMLAAAGALVLFQRNAPCAKYHHQNRYRCIFCEFQAARQARTHAASSNALTLAQKESGG